MAISNFKIDYHNGWPDVDYNDLVYWEPIYGDWAGGFSAMESVDDPDQAQVFMQIESSTTILTNMKADSPRYEWIEDVAGWGARSEERKLTPEHKKKLTVYTLTKTIGKVKIILASGVNLDFVKR